MLLERSEALAAARRLVRGFKSAPDPLKQARAVQQALIQAADLTAAERAEVTGMDELLDQRSSGPALASAFRRLIAKLT